jgi:long-chain fatty acid transport protein
MTAFRIKALIAASTLALMAGVTSAAHAGGFYLQDLSAKQAGNAYSGAVTAKGADALWWNPAAIAGSTTKELSFGASYIDPKGSVDDTGSVIVRPGQAPASVGGNASSKDPISTGVLPNGSFSMPINDRIAIGVTVTAPYSFETNYETGSWARYDADKTRLTTIDIQPVIAFKVNDWLDLGVGLNAEYTKAILNNALPNLSPLLADGAQTLEGDGWNYGYTVGAQAHHNKITVGLSYKSAIKHELDGNLTISGLLGPIAGSNGTIDNLSATFSTPSQAMLGVTVQATDKLALHAQAISFGWSEFDYITISAPVSQAIPEDYRDTVSFAVGGDYVINPKWTVRAGIQSDQTPTRDGHRDARVPDADRVDYALGTSYQVTPNFAIDAAFTYVAFDKSVLSTTTAAYAGTAVQTPIVIKGELNDASASVLSIGGHFTF